MINSLEGMPPMEFRNEIVVEIHHQRGHPGVQQTYDLVAEVWWWPRMYTDIRELVTKCERCRAGDGETALSAWSRTTLHTHHFQALEFDFLTVAKTNEGHQCLLVVCL